ncbi:hypothetical protein K9N68_12130 [Kovacikia minuta CCNUW1]|uniref:hypothetical protein n=1 Tax=Kovacikia minuta TaxID=2931930 RepID=UPI001CC8EF68|nr:hypothetical protein [Kovacikia minuta]UBF28553.1 hypothetical protein K9N68_12130 [Kovacikia minuta CCNUW1]
MSTPNRQNWQMGICRAYIWESRPAPAMGATLSKNQTEPDGLVGSPKTRPVHPQAANTAV